jgi:hypothetical protein
MFMLQVPSFAPNLYIISTLITCIKGTDSRQGVQKRDSPGKLAELRGPRNLLLRNFKTSNLTSTCPLSYTRIRRILSIIRRYYSPTIPLRKSKEQILSLQDRGIIRLLRQKVQSNLGGAIYRPSKERMNLYTISDNHNNI